MLLMIGIVLNGIAPFKGVSQIRLIIRTVTLGVYVASLLARETYEEISPSGMMNLLERVKLM